jgi:hypothetical protein
MDFLQYIIIDIGKFTERSKMTPPAIDQYFEAPLIEAGRIM